MSITDHQNNPSGYEGGNQEIGYDLNGNMTSMPDKGISKIDYNYLNLPNKLNYSRNDIESVSVATKYGADGEKLRKENTTSITGIAGVSVSKKTTDYLDGFQYLKTESISSPTFPGNPGGGGSEGLMANSETGRALEMQAYTLEPQLDPPPPNIKTADLQFFPTAEGFYDYVKDQYIYQYKDHLGNVRVSFARNSANALEIVDANDYYPFGMNHLKSGTSFFGTSSYKNYKYNGKELQESGMYDYGARFYMPDIGRWGVVDPLAETSRRWSPYTYAYNNPLRFTDPDGMQNEDKIKIFNNGNIERTKDDNAYDTITNENESKSIRIARTNVSDKNEKGDSQIGEMKSLPFDLPESDGMEGSASSKYSYLQIENYDAATQFFEFAAENTKVEFSQDTFNFSDGYSTSIIGTNHSVNQSVNAGAMLAPYSFGGHILQDGTHTENVHSHPPGSNVGPSGWNSKFINNVPTMTYGLKQGDAKFRSDNLQIMNTYQYGTWKWPTPGKGYFKYDSKNATFTGSKKN